MSKRIFYRRDFAKIASFSLTLLFADPAIAKDISFQVNEGTNFAVVAAPNGSAMAMDIQGRIWVVSSKGGIAKAITPVMDEARYPVWSPDGKLLAFQFYTDGNWHIAIIRPDGSDLRQLTFGSFDDREPSWKPDGKTIVFSSDRERSLDIWELAIKTGETKPLTSGPDDDYYPAVSSNKDRFVFVRHNSRGAGARPLARDSVSTITAQAGAINLIESDGKSETTLESGESEIGRPQWSPDGRAVAFTVCNLDRGDCRIDVLDSASGKLVRRHSDGGTEDIFPTGASWMGAGRIVYAADGGIRIWSLATNAISKVPFQATFTVMEKPQFAKKTFDFTSTGDRKVMGILRPMVSPDGAKIAFTALGNLWLLKVGDPRPVQLTHDGFLNVDPTWSRDGKRLAYVSDRRGTGTMDLYIRDMETGAEKRITQTDEDLLQPSWSPDGRTIAVFMRTASDFHAATLYMVDPETGAMRQAFNKLFLPSVPSWSVDGRKISVNALRPWSDRFRKGYNAFFTIDLATRKGRFTTPDADRSIGSRSQFGPIWSPDGTHIAYIHDGLLWSAAVDADANLLEPPLQLSSTYAAYPSWTGDSKSLVFLTGTRLERVYLEGGHVDDIPLDLTWHRSANAQRLVIQAGRVFTGVSPDYLRDVDIVVDDNVITQITPRRASWPGAAVIDARDKTVVPGLFQTHNHQYVSDGEKLGRMWLSFGITSVREPGVEPYEALERREGWMSGERLGPREFYANILEGNRVFYWMNATVIPNAQVELELQRSLDLDYDFIKTYETMDFEVMRRIVEFAHAHGLMVASHELYPAVTYGADAVEHLETTDRMEFTDRMSPKRREYEDVLQLMSKSGIYNSPTDAGRAPSIMFLAEMDLHPEILDLPQVKAFAPRYKEAYAEVLAYMRRIYGDSAPARSKDDLQSLAKLSKAGVVFGSGTDGGTVTDGYSVILEIIHFANAFGPYRALRAGTIDAAKITGVDRYLGSVETGKIADMVIVNGDPLHNVADLYHVDTVIKDGRPHTLSEILQPPH